MLKYDNKIFTFTKLYFQKNLADYIGAKKDKILKEIKEVIKIINETNLKCLKIKYIKDIIKELKIYNFDLKEHFNKNNIEIYFPKTKKDNDNPKKNAISFEDFINEIKKYIGNIDDKINIDFPEPTDLILQLFLNQAGLKKN